jgi:hypothetical protein
MQKIAWDITWDNLGAERLQTQQYRGMDPMDSKRRIVAACSGFLERRSKGLIAATFGAPSAAKRTSRETCCGEWTADDVRFKTLHLRS